MAQKVLYAIGGLTALAVATTAMAGEPGAGNGSAVPGVGPSAYAEAPALPHLLAQSDNSGVYPDDRILGDPEAPITMIEFSSLTCPHCAAFHRDTLPQLKTEWLETGRARLVFRDFPLDKVAANAAVLARCMPEDRYFSFIEVLFRGQDNWARSQDPRGALTQLARTAGLDGDTIDACFEDDAAWNTLATRYKEAQELYDVRSTPTFIINGEVMPGARTYEDFNTFLEGLEPEA